MGDFSHRVTMAVLASELMPASLRTTLMRQLGFRMSKEACIWAGAILRSKKISIAEGVFINVGFFHDGYDELTIEKNVRIGQFVRVLTATHDIGPHEQRGLIEVVGKPVVLGAGSWIGSGVTILPGISIAPGCVLGTNALITKSTEPDGLYVGNPARRVRDLPVEKSSEVLGHIRALTA